MAKQPKSMTDAAWNQWDRLVADATSASPWSSSTQPQGRYAPDYDLLAALLSIPVQLGASSQSGLPAKAVDVWLAHELRRCGFVSDEVWPRQQVPRVLPREVALLRRALPKRLAEQLFERIDAGQVRAGVTSADANVLGKAYVKQVDVGMAQWSRGPEILISSKRMDSSFGKNALNRVEESYGDSKNLRGRHPLAATGFVLVLRSVAFERERDTTLRLLDLLVKLAAESDGYDATAVVVAQWDDSTQTPLGDDPGRRHGHDDNVRTTGVVRVRHDLVPPELDPAAFIATIVDCVLTRTPVDLHREARRRRGQEVPSSPSPDQAS